MRLSFISGICAILCTALANGSRVWADAPATRAAAARTGEFEISFTERSSQSSKERLQYRLAEEDLGPDYDLAQEPFVVYVPSGYSPEKPAGIVVYVTEEGAGKAPWSLKPLLNQRNVIFIMAKKASLSALAETGLSIDAVFNLKKMYNVEDRRVFLMGTGFIESAGMATPDIFAGDVWIWSTGYWNSFPVGKRSYRPIVHAPQEGLLPLAEKRPHVFGWEPDYKGGVRSLVPGQMTQDGFEHMLTAVIPANAVAYPSLDPVWFGKMLDMLESVSLKAPAPGTQPSVAEHPGPGAAQEMLNLAQAYLDAGNTDMARDKLQALIEKYPDDPAADKAKALLSQISGQ